MTTSDYGIIIATLLGPILAVQAQKFIERVSARRNKKAWIFDTLMTTRLTRAAPEHVRALNMIDLAFSAPGFLRQTPTEREQKVLEAWKAYLDCLNDPAANTNQEQWNARAQDFFIDLLYHLSRDTGYRFDKVQIKNACYRPISHGNFESETNVIRENLAKILSGKSSLNMNVTGLPIDKEFAQSQLKLHTTLSDALTGQSAIAVKLVDTKQPPASQLES